MSDYRSGPWSSWQRDPSRTGQTLVIFALASTLLLAGLGLVFDAGYNFAQRRAMQNAADAAAFAGTRLLMQSPTSTQIYATVTSVAVQNGVPSAANVSCWYITDTNTSGVAACAANTAPPTNLGTITGVRVDVGETHRTFVMRVIGITTTGTKATATTQAQVLSSYARNAIPFLPCGIGTATASGTALSILNTYQDPIYDRWGNITGYTEKVLNDATTGYASINTSRYGYDWTGGLNAGLPKPGAGVAAKSGSPEYIIHAPNPHDLADCDLGGSSFKGLNDTTATGTVTLPALAYDDSSHTGTTQIVQGDNGTRAGPTRALFSSLGCKGNNFNGCVLILPVVDNSGPGGNGNNLPLAARLWAAFWITEVGANEHHAWLIANYPLTGAGSTGWTSSYTGPSMIRLIK